MAIGDTLQVPIHPNAPAPQPKSRRAAWVALAVAVMGVGAFATWKLRSSTPTTSATNTSPAPPATSSEPAIVSAAPIACVVPSVAPSATATAITTTTPATATAIAPPPPRKLAVNVRANPSPQYDDAAANRGVSGAKFSIKSCIEQNPPKTIPTSFAITLSLWSFAEHQGQVRDVTTQQAPALGKCLRDALMGLEFGPPKGGLPPGAVFVSVNVDAVK